MAETRCAAEREEGRKEEGKGARKAAETRRGESGRRERGVLSLVSVSPLYEQQPPPLRSGGASLGRMLPSFLPFPP